VVTDGRTVTGTETVGTDLGNITAVVATTRSVYFLTLEGKIRRVTTA